MNAEERETKRLALAEPCVWTLPGFVGVVALKLANSNVPSCFFCLVHITVLYQVRCLLTQWLVVFFLLKM